MYNIQLGPVSNRNDYEELIKVFLKPDEYRLLADDEGEACLLDSEDIFIKVPEHLFCGSRLRNPEKTEKNAIKRFLYGELSKYTGQVPDWGILTGVRPVKMTGELLEENRSATQVKEILLKEYYLSPEKADLLLNISNLQSRLLGPSPKGAIGLYIGIPFCPTRCIYCSFTSNQAKDDRIKNYLTALHQEIHFTAEEMGKKSWFPETLYVGGGTPTTLSADDLDDLLAHLHHSFDLTRLKEFTVEAGRPDTITLDKLETMKRWGVGRISINPQSMNDKTLKIIGRTHSTEDIVKAFQLARTVGISVINADIIAGLPGEDVKDLERTLKILLALEPENVTVHTLAVKRASRLKEIDSDYHYHQGQKVREMLAISRKMLSPAGYEPYYLYRQKQMSGNFENVGYAKPGTEGIYNIRIMEERQSIIALGAGGMSKVYYPEENRLERIANVSNYEIYIERLDEMIQRKKDNLFCSRNL